MCESLVKMTDLEECSPKLNTVHRGKRSVTQDDNRNRGRVMKE